MKENILKKIKIKTDKNGNFIKYGSYHPICFCGTFNYDGKEEDLFFPITLGRYGIEDFISIETEDNITDEFIEYLEKIYNELNPVNREKWRNRVRALYKPDTNKYIIFNNLYKNLNKPVNTPDSLPNNSNPQGPLRDLREDGFCIITKKGSPSTYTLVEGISTKGFVSEHISPVLKEKVLNYYNNIDAISGEKKSKLIVEHKFPEERWGAHRANDKDDLSEHEIEQKFQLFTDQFNKVKREACRICVRTSERQCPFNIEFFYQGSKEWNCVAEKGLEAEEGCKGCGWYDFAKWKKELIKCANKGQKNN